VTRVAPPLRHGHAGPQDDAEGALALWTAPSRPTRGRWRRWWWSPWCRERRGHAATPPEPEPDPLELQPSLPLCVEPEDVPRRKPWAWLLKHVFDEDVSVCPRCQGPTTWLEVATEPDAIDRALANHGLSPPRARPPPLPPLSPDAQLCLPL